MSDVYDNEGYPFMHILEGNSPDGFSISLKRVKHFLNQDIKTPKIFTINAWNEGTDGSYLEPDTIHGMGYLKAIPEVFTK